MIWFSAKTLLGAALKLFLAAAIVFFALDFVSGEAPGSAALTGGAVVVGALVFNELLSLRSRVAAASA